MSHDGGDTVHVDALPWLSLAPNVYVKVIKLVPETGAFSVMIKADKGGVLPRHQHLEKAEIYIIKGEGDHKQTGHFRAGDYVSERKGAIHDELPFEEDTELLMICDGASAFIDEHNNVRFMMNVPMLQHLSQSQAQH